MTGKRIAGIACFLLAPIGLLSAITTISKGPPLSEPEGQSHAVGALMFPLVIVMLGVWLFQKPKPKGS